VVALAWTCRVPFFRTLNTLYVLRPLFLRLKKGIYLIKRKIKRKDEHFFVKKLNFARLFGVLLSLLLLLLPCSSFLPATSTLGTRFAYAFVPCQPICFARGVYWRTTVLQTGDSSAAPHDMFRKNNTYLFFFKVCSPSRSRTGPEGRPRWCSATKGRCWISGWRGPTAP